MFAALSNTQAQKLSSSKFIFYEFTGEGHYNSIVKLFVSVKCKPRVYAIQSVVKYKMFYMYIFQLYSTCC